LTLRQTRRSHQCPGPVIRPVWRSAGGVLDGGVRVFRRPGCGRLAAGLPGIVAAGMEVKRHALSVQFRFDLILDVVFSEDAAAEIARQATAFPTPHPDRDGAPQLRQSGPRCAQVLGMCVPIRRNRSIHPRFAPCVQRLVQTPFAARGTMRRNIHCSKRLLASTL